ncbi:hypothetical protein FG386_000423 [Cryptosporidium ryanae]|uniref:uncharacterized protein n=1 Tax=Cryptosporidium ryanae TaxID=515981 RepID=UPI00351A5C4F|nr:hypothetical protein FG386_000423 [Cryptosporidium ryanae]
MQSIFKNAFDKVYVIKDAVKNNPKDSAYVLNTGASITSSIVNWAEKNNVSEKANNIRNSASVLVGDLASGIKGVTNNISLQTHNFGEKFMNNQDKKKQTTDEYDYFQDNFSSFNNIYLEVNQDDLFGFKNRSNFDDVSGIRVKQTEPENDFPPTNNYKNIYGSLIDNSEPSDKSSCLLLETESKSNIKSDNTVQKHNIKDLSKNKAINDSLGVNSENIIGRSDILNTEISDLSLNEKNHNTSNRISNIICDNISSNHINSEYIDLNLNSGMNSTLDNELTESYSKHEVNPILGVNTTSDPLFVFQQIGNLEKENLLLKEEIASMKSEIFGLNEKLDKNEKIIDNLTHKNIKLMNENKLLSHDIEHIKNEVKNNKTHLEDLEIMTNKVVKFEETDKKQKNTIKMLEYKVTELENTISLLESEKMESTKNFQNEIMELRQQLLHTNETENKISLPYLNRIRTLEDQLNETRISHSQEIQRFEVIIGNLRNQNISEKNEYRKLGELLSEERALFNSNIKKLELQIKHYKDTVRNLEKNNAKNYSRPPEIIINKLINLNMCTKVIEIDILGNSLSSELPIEKDLDDKKIIYLNTSLTSKVNTKNVSPSNSLQEELKQIITDKQLLEEEYIRICNEKKRTEDILSEERQRSKLLQQQLDNLLKLANELTDKLDNTNEIVKLQKKELQKVHLRLK